MLSISCAKSGASIASGRGKEDVEDSFSTGDPFGEIGRVAERFLVVGKRRERNDTAFLKAKSGQ